MPGSHSAARADEECARGGEIMRAADGVTCERVPELPEQRRALRSGAPRAKTHRPDDERLI